MSFGYGYGFAVKRSRAPGAPAAPSMWDFGDFTTQITGTGAQAQIVSDSVGRATRVTGSAGGLVLALPAGTYRIRGALTDWSGNGAAHLRLSSGSLAIPVNFTPVAGSSLYTANGAVDCTFTFAAPDNLVLRSTVDGRSFTLTAGADPLVVAA